ncbi:MAG: sugar kinase [Gammaproteobacteria bacterium]|nr:sugar kinase [Gammaproteobacteria bacterium]
MSLLEIRSKEDSQLDLVSLGSLVHRLDPGIIPFRKARSVDIHVSGGEYNVASGLSDCFGMRTAIVSAMVNYGIGELVETRIREMGVKPIFKRFEHNGVDGPNIATVYSDRGMGVRPPVVFYNRANEAGGMLKAGDFDWDEIFGQGVRWFHSGGIYAALSNTTGGLIIEAMKAAKKHGVVTSFDLNYRPKLWAPKGGLQAAQKTFREITKYVDVLLGNEEDMQLGLGIKGQDVEKASKLNTDAFFGMIKEVTAQFPNIQAAATTLREVETTNRHQWSAVTWCKGETATAPIRELGVIDRIGGGDGFATGLIYGFLDGRSLDDTIRLGWAHGALLTTFPGDTTMAKLPEVEAFAKGGSARVQR